MLSFMTMSLFSKIKQIMQNNTLAITLTRDSSNANQTIRSSDL